MTSLIGISTWNTYQTKLSAATGALFNTRITKVSYRTPGTFKIDIPALIYKI